MALTRGFRKAFPNMPKQETRSSIASGFSLNASLSLRFIPSGMNPGIRTVTDGNAVAAFGAGRAGEAFAGGWGLWIGREYVPILRCQRKAQRKCFAPTRVAPLLFLTGNRLLTVDN
jgi:hypothetical protein